MSIYVSKQDRPGLRNRIQLVAGHVRPAGITVLIVVDGMQPPLGLFPVSLAEQVQYIRKTFCGAQMKLQKIKTSGKNVAVGVHKRGKHPPTPEVSDVVRAFDAGTTAHHSPVFHEHLLKFAAISPAKICVQNGHNLGF